MQYRLSTLFLIFLVVATTLATFGVAGLWISPIVLLIAFQMNHARRPINLVELLVIIAIIGILVGLVSPGGHVSREPLRINQCVDNLKKIGEALRHYDAEHGCLPMATVKDAKGHELHSWRVEIWPELGYGSVFDQLKNDEGWDNSYNLELLNPRETPEGKYLFAEFFCPSACEKNVSNYAAVIGPGTAWHENKPVQVSELADGGKHTVAALEVLNNGKHWAEPENFTVAKLMDRLKTVEESGRLSNHPQCAHVLFADGSVWGVPLDMPKSLWERLLSGDIVSVHELNNGKDRSAFDVAVVSYDASAKPDYFQFDSPATAPSLYALPVWLVSVILLFRRAYKSRKPPIDVQAAANASSAG
jgi:hypothetical protein